MSSIRAQKDCVQSIVDTCGFYESGYCCCVVICCFLQGSNSLEPNVALWVSGFLVGMNTVGGKGGFHFPGILISPNQPSFKAGLCGSMPPKQPLPPCGGSLKEMYIHTHPHVQTVATSVMRSQMLLPPQGMVRRWECSHCRRVLDLSISEKAGGG